MTEKDQIRVDYTGGVRRIILNSGILVGTIGLLGGLIANLLANRLQDDLDLGGIFISNLTIYGIVLLATVVLLLTTTIYQRRQSSNVERLMRDLELRRPSEMEFMLESSRSLITKQRDYQKQSIAIQETIRLLNEMITSIELNNIELQAEVKKTDLPKDYRKILLKILELNQEKIILSPSSKPSDVEVADEIIALSGDENDDGN